MSLPSFVKTFFGKWSGKNRLHLPWVEEDPVRESDSNAVVSFVGGGRFLKIEYDWTFEGEAQDGVLIACCSPELEVSAVWLDSWHLSAEFMHCSGPVQNEAIVFEGSYRVPDQADWIWRTEIKSGGKENFSIVMHNIFPEGGEDLAVEMNFLKVKEGNQ